MAGRIDVQRWPDALTCNDGRTITVEVPWPPRELSPNSRLHWAVRSPIRAQYREDCGWVAKEAMQKHGLGRHLAPPVWASVRFVASDAMRRDEDNLLSMLKACWDGMVDAGLIRDDRATDLHIVAIKVESWHQGSRNADLRPRRHVEITLQAADS